MKNFTLDNEPRIKSGFVVPDNYFDSFSDRLMIQFPENETKVISIFGNRKLWIYAAAAVLVLSISIPVCNQFLSNSNEIDDVNIENYMACNTAISETDLASLLNENDLQKMKLDLKIEDQTIEDELSPNSNLEQYLTQ